MVSYIENYLKDYGDKLVSEKSLKYILPIIYSDVIKEISIKQICSFYDDVDLIDDNLKNKRFDFISVSNKLIIEFDGRQHFEHIEHFGGFEQFVERQNIDLDKQRFIKENNFHLIRITGKLTLREFYDLIKDKIFTNENPKAIFIENNNIYETPTDKLKDTLDEGENLNVIIFDLKNQVKMLSNELKNQANYFNNHLNDKKLIGKNKKILNLLTNSDNDVYLFLDWSKNLSLMVGKITTAYFYQMYLYWNKYKNENIKPLRRREFTEQLRKLESDFKFSVVMEQTRLSSLKKYECNPELINKLYFNNELKYDIYMMSTYIIFNEQITQHDLNVFDEKLEQNKIEDINNYKDWLILETLINKLNPDAIKFKEYIIEKQSI